MNDFQRRRLINSRKDYARRRRSSMDYARGDYNRSSNYGRSTSDYMGEEYMEDMRRGVKGSGRGRRRRDYGEDDYEYTRNRNDYMEEYDDEEEYDGYYPFKIEGEMGYDYADTHKLSKRDIMEWKRELVNADGSKGEHFKIDHIMKAAKDMGIRFHEYDEKELCLTVNMLYSDYCEVLKPFISPDKELYVYVALGKAFLEDEDAPEGSEKLALYYHCIVNAE